MIFLLIICAIFAMSYKEATQIKSNNSVLEDEEKSDITNASLESLQNEFQIEEIYSTEYHKSISEDGIRLPDVCWEYLRSSEYLEEIVSKTYLFQYPKDLDFEKYSYVVSFGCKIIKCWSEEMIEDDHVLSVVYDPQYQGKKVFLYKLPKIKIYPFKWPTYIVKEGEKLHFANTPVYYQEGMLDGYEFRVDFPINEIYDAVCFEMEGTKEKHFTNSDIEWEYICDQEYMNLLSEKFQFLCPENLDFNSHSYIITFGYQIVECWSEEMIGDEYVLRIICDSQYCDKNVFFYQFPKVKISTDYYANFAVEDNEKLPLEKIS